MSTFADLPKFDDLEDKKRFWPAKPGTRDEGLGMLRYLTPEHVAKVVKQEVKTGERVCLNWEMTRLETPGMHSILSLFQQARPFPGTSSRYP
jgi:hypothetical protein